MCRFHQKAQNGPAPIDAFASNTLTLTNRSQARSAKVIEIQCLYHSGQNRRKIRHATLNKFLTVAARIERPDEPVANRTQAFRKALCGTGRPYSLHVTLRRLAAVRGNSVSASCLLHLLLPARCATTRNPLPGFRPTTSTGRPSSV